MCLTSARAAETSRPGMEAETRQLVRNPSQKRAPQKRTRGGEVVVVSESVEGYVGQDWRDSEGHCEEGVG